MADSETSEASGRASTRYFSATAIRIGLLAFVFSGALLALRYAVIQVPEGDFAPNDRSYITLYDPPRTKTDTMIDVADGQAWAALGRDPTFSHPEYFYDTEVEFTYRAQRPLYGLAVWAFTFAQPDLVPLSLMVTTSLGVALLAATTVKLAEREKRLARGAAAVIFLPGTIFVIMVFGPEPLAVGLATIGLLHWRQPDRRPWLGVLFLTAAVMTKEFLVLIPATIAFYELVRERRRLRDLLPLAVPLVVFVAWFTSLRIRWGHWPSEWHKLENFARPFSGLWRALPTFDLFRDLGLLLGIVLVVLAVRRDRWSLLTWIAVVFLLASTLLGVDVWSSEFFRVLLPMYVYSLVVVLPAAPPVRVRAGAAAT